MTARHGHILVADDAAPRQNAEIVWKTLAPLMAARPTMRTWCASRRFDDSRPLTAALPDAPAAVPLYTRNRTRLLALDLDAKHQAPQQVCADRDRLLGWIAECGGRAVVDSSTSGGVHILVPLHRGVTVDEVRPLLTALKVQCPTLDPTPMLNPRTGCITVPGSPCREGGFRILTGDLSRASEVFTRRSHPEFLAALTARLATSTPLTVAAGTAAPDDLFIGHSNQRSLHPTHRLHTPMPAAVEAFARTGTLPADRRWPSRSEARQSVLTHAMWRGATLADIEHLSSPGRPWHAGLGRAYHRYGPHPQHALIRDWTRAQHWLITSLPRFQASTHKKEHTGGTKGAPAHNRWLAHANWWCDTTLRSHPHRWSVAAVLQALAVCALRAGTLVDGVPVVAVGGRSLSIAAGLLSESTVWSVLRMLRDTPGAPILLIEKGTGLNADRYALTTPDTPDPQPDGVGRPEVRDVHDAWSVIGLSHRRVYELVAATDFSTAHDVACASRISLSSAHNSLAELARIGLLRRSHGVVAPGPLDLDDIAERHRTEQNRADRISGHRQARQRWQAWLAARRNPPPQLITAPPPPSPAPILVTMDVITHADYLTAVMATGPPPLSY